MPLPSAISNGESGSSVRTKLNTVIAEHNFESIIIPFSDETTPLTTGTNKVRFRMPFGFMLTGIRANLGVAQSSGSILTIDVNKNGTTVLSTKITIDNTEKTSVTAATPPVISVSSFSSDDEVEIDVDQVGVGDAVAGKVTLIGYRQY